MAALKTCLVRAFCSWPSDGLRALQLSGTGAAAIFGMAVLSANAPVREKGQVTVVIVDSATLQSGVVRDSHRGLVIDARPRAENQPESKRSHQRAMRRSDKAIIIDLP